MGDSMKCLVIAAGLCLSCLNAANAATSAPTEQDAIAMAERGAALLKSHGKIAMIKRINAKDPDFVQGPLHLDVRDLKSGIVLAAPFNRSVVGRDLLDVPDSNGKKYRREIIELAASKGKGWVEYQYKNPASGRIEPQTTYVLRAGDIVLEAGLYRQ
jgi:cytochrome c